MDITHELAAWRAAEQAALDAERRLQGRQLGNSPEAMQLVMEAKRLREDADVLLRALLEAAKQELPGAFEPGDPEQGPPST
jgi:hypothetical protein